jgi:hypothetical protein
MHDLLLSILLNSGRELNGSGILGQELDTFEREDGELVVEMDVDGDRSLLLHEHDLHEKED